MYIFILGLLCQMSFEVVFKLLNEMEMGWRLFEDFE